MDNKELLEIVDHTMLNQASRWEDIKGVCDDAIFYKTASVCIPPYFVRQAKEYVKDKVKICTVIGFPNGYNTMEVKVFEAKNAIENGADEIDMVINIGNVKEEKWESILEEIVTIKKKCGTKILKVIIETCLLTEKEKIKMCNIVTKSGADYIKTSTGFSVGGATAQDITLFKEHIGCNVKIKAAGGMATLEDAHMFRSLGAARLGSSKIINLTRNKSSQGY